MGMVFRAGQAQAGSILSMANTNADTHFDRGPAADLWRHTLARVPTHFGRLVYLSSLRNQNTGCYEHHGLAQMFGDEQAGDTLSRSHAQIFQEWLCLNLEQQKTDLQEYLGELPGNPAAVLATWLRLAPYRNLVPAPARDVERQLFLTDVEALLAVLKHEYAVASPDPES